MRANPGRWLTALRRRQRAIFCALLPAFALSAMSAPACAAMLAASASVTAEVAAAEGHAAHHHAGARAAEPAVPAAYPCPHCPLESGAANAGHASCTAIAGQSDGELAQPTTASERAPLMILSNWLLPAARAAPPLIVSVARSRAHLGAPVALNLRHRVLLI